MCFDLCSKICSFPFLSEDEAALKAKGQHSQQQHGNNKGGNRKSPKVAVKGEKKEEEKEEKGRNPPKKSDCEVDNSDQTQDSVARAPPSSNAGRLLCWTMDLIREL